MKIDQKTPIGSDLSFGSTLEAIQGIEKAEAVVRQLVRRVMHNGSDRDIRISTGVQGARRVEFLSGLAVFAEFDLELSEYLS